MLNKLLLEQLTREVIFRDHPIIKPRGGIIELLLNPQQTKFNVNDYIKQSKKTRRSMKLENKEKPILQYSIVGKCLAFRKRGINTSFTLRNVVSLCPFEMTFALFTTYVTAFAIRHFFRKSRRVHYNRASHYEFRKISPHKTRIKFSYVLNKIYTVVRPS